MSIENPTLVHFRHFSSLFTLSPLYICRESSTNQSFLCKTNPILSAVGGLQMNVNIFTQMDYENKSNWTLGQSKPNSNPIKPNFRKAKMNANSLITKDYRKNDDFSVRINKPNLSRRSPERSRITYPPKGQNRSPMPDVRGQISVFCLLFSVFCPRRLLIAPMLPLYKLSNVQYYSRHNFKVKFPIISIISILRQAKLTKYRWKIMPAAAIFNPIKKLTITWTGANLKGRRVI